MSKSQRLRLRDVRGVYRLVGACRELGDDAPTWRRHMLTGLCRLLDAQVAVGGERRLGRAAAGALHFDDCGWPSPAARGAYQAWLRDPAASHSLPAPLLDFHQLPGPVVTRCRQEVVGDRAWFASTFFNEALRPFGLGGEAVVSLYVFPGRVAVQQLSLTRALGAPRCGRRERRLLGLFHRQLGPLVGGVLAAAWEPCPSDLAPRLRQTLDALLEGDSEKQAALRLGLSVATIHEYVGAVYRHFGVASRAELLASFLRRARGRPPQG